MADIQASPRGATPNAALVRSAARSPFAGHATGERPNRAGDIGVRITAGMLPGVVLLSTWISGIDGLLSALASALGSVPQRAGHTTNTPLGLLARTGPEEFLLIAAQPSDPCAQMRQAIAADVGAVTDLSHARCRIHIEGPQCQTVLNKLFALDLRSDAFPVGEVRLTGTHHVPCVLHRLGADSFNMLVFSTYAYDQLHTLVDAALEYGVGLTLE